MADDNNVLHKHKHRIRTPLIAFIVILCIILLAGGSLFTIQNKTYLKQKIIETGEQSFQVDHLLLKVLLKEREFAQQEVRILNTAQKEQEFSLFIEGVEDIVSLDEPSFSLPPDAAKVVTARFNAADAATSVEHQPGVYAGMFSVESSSQQEIPLIVEIESSQVMFDTNLNPVTLENKVDRGKDFVIEVRLFNLQSVNAENVDMQYAVKDIHGNTLLTEHETVVVKTQASFFKTVSIPLSVAPGTYVFIAESRVGSSVGTSSYLFEVLDPTIDQSAPLRSFCKNDPLCTGLSISMLILLLSVAAYFYLFVGAYFYQKMSKVFSPQAALGKQQEGKGWLSEFVEKWSRNAELKCQQKEKRQKEKEQQHLAELKLRQEENERVRKEQERRQKGLEKQKRFDDQKRQKEEAQYQQEQHRLARVESARRMREEAKSKLEEQKLKQEREAGRAQEHLEMEKLSVEKWKQRMNFLKMVLFGRKHDGIIKKMAKTKAILDINALLKQGVSEIEQSKLKQARSTYEKTLKKYGAMSIGEKKGVYFSLTSFYNRLVEAENKYHKHEKQLQQPPFLVRLGLVRSVEEREKQRKLEESNRKKQQEEQAKLERQRQAELKKQQNEAEKQEKSRLVELKKQELAAKKEEANRLNQEKLQQNLIVEEQRKRQGEIDKQGELRQHQIREKEGAYRKRQEEINGIEKNITNFQQQSLETAQHKSKAMQDISAIAEIFPSSRGKKRQQLEKKYENIQQRINKLEQKQAAIENNILNARKSLFKLEGGMVNSIKMLFLPTAYKPKLQKLPPLHPAHQEAKAQQEQTVKKEESQAQEPAHSEQVSLVQSLSQDELTKKSSTFRKYKKAIAEAEDAANKGNTQAAKSAYLKARELYLKLEYAERTEVYNELNAVYTRLSQ